MKVIISILVGALTLMFQYASIILESTPIYAYVASSGNMYLLNIIVVIYASGVVTLFILSIFSVCNWDPIVGISGNRDNLIWLVPIILPFLGALLPLPRICGNNKLIIILASILKFFDEILLIVLGIFPAILGLIVARIIYIFPWFKNQNLAFWWELFGAFIFPSVFAVFLYRNFPNILYEWKKKADTNKDERKARLFHDLFNKAKECWSSDPEQAFKLIQRINHDFNDDYICYLYGLMWYVGHGTNSDVNKAIKWIKKSYDSLKETRDSLCDNDDDDLNLPPDYLLINDLIKCESMYQIVSSQEKDFRINWKKLIIINWERLLVYSRIWGPMDFLHGSYERIPETDPDYQFHLL